MTFRYLLPLYLANGLINLFDECCSIIWADQPVILEITNIGVKKSVSKPIKW